MTIGAAEFGPAKNPRASPNAQNGIAPATWIAKIVSIFTGVSCTCAPTAATRNSSATMIAPNVIAIAIFAMKYALIGIGVVRFASSHPCPRSTATETPNPNNAAPITPNVPYVASMYSATCGPFFDPNITPKK